MSSAAAIGAALTMIAGNVASKDELCNRLDRFERALARSNSEVTSVKMTYDWPNWTAACSADESSEAKLCSWIVRHTSIEFPQTVIQRVVACYTHVESLKPGWNVQTVDTDLLTKAGNRLRVEADLRSSPDLPWVRLTLKKAK